jgi:hypothetical protein
MPTPGDAMHRPTTPGGGNNWNSAVSTLVFTGYRVAALENRQPIRRLIMFQILFWVAVVLGLICMTGTSESMPLIIIAWIVVLSVGGWSTFGDLQSFADWSRMIDRWLDYADYWTYVHSAFIARWILLLLLVMFIKLVVTVLRKRALIRAVALDIPLEMSRCEPIEPAERWMATEAILTRIGIDGQTKVNSSKAPNFPSIFVISVDKGKRSEQWPLTPIILSASAPKLSFVTLLRHGSYRHLVPGSIL